MRRLALFLSVVMLITSFGGFSVWAAVADDSTDGALEWGGYTWDAKCTPEGVAASVKNAQPCDHGWMYVDSENVMNFQMQYDNKERGQFHMIQIPYQTAGFPENFDVEFDMKMTEYGEGLGFQIFVPGMRLYSEFESRGFLYQGNDGIKLIDVVMDNEWHNWRMAVREDKYSVFRDGQEILTDELQNIGSNSVYDGDVRFYSTPSVNVAPKAQMKNFDITKYDNYIGMTPNADDTYLMGQDVILKANVNDGAESVTYYAGNVAIGTSTAAENYEYKLAKPAVGAYTVWANTSSGKQTFPRTFSVTNDSASEIICSDEVGLGQSVSLSLSETNDNTVFVNYYVNGILAGKSEEAPFNFDATMTRAGSSTIFAEVHMDDGSYITTDTKTVNVWATGSGNFDISREYDLTFDAGSGYINVNDGYFKLSISRSGSGFTYEDRDGTKHFYGGSGTYRAIVSAGIADVYKDGQLAFSYNLPRSQSASGLSYSGFSNVKLTGSGVKNTVFERVYNGEKESVDDNLNMDLFYSLEFDKTDSSGESILLFDGEYRISLKFNGGITALAQPETGGKTEEQKLSDSVKPGYYRLTVYRGLANLFVDNNHIAAFRAPKESGRRTLRRVMSNPDATTFAAIKNSDDVFYFAENFSGKGQREPLEYWYNIYKDTTAVVENEALNISGRGTILLDVTAENPSFTWKMTPALSETQKASTGSKGCDGESGSTSTVTRSGSFAIGIRYRNEYNNVKIKYDHSSGTWTLVETVTGTATTVATADKLLANGEEKEYTLDIKNDKLTFVCGGEDVFRDVRLSFLGNGKFGFSLDETATVKIDDITYEGNGKVNSGVSYSFWTTDEVVETVEFLEGPNGEAYFSTLDGANKRQVYTSTDYETWTGPVENSKFTRDAVNLQSGRVLRVESAKGISRATLYESDGVTEATDETGAAIAHFVAIQSPDDTARRWAMPGRLTQGKKVWGTTPDAAPRVYYVMNEGSEVSGDITLYFSDDEGKTWKESTTLLTYASMGNFYGGEPEVVELPDGRVRIYFRGDRGFLHYTDSYDGGVTFGLKPIPSMFMTPSTCFSIERDSDNDSTYYMIWEYDTTTAAVSYIQQPRNRQALAVSYDGCENWEYIMEMDDQGPVRTTSHMNASMRVFGGKVYVNHAYLDGMRYSDEEVIKNIVYIVDPQKMNAVKRFANAHYIEPDFKTVYDYIHGQAIIPKQSGTAMLYGNLFPARTDDGGMVENEIMAKAVGATWSKTEDGVKLTLGSGEVLFTKNSKEYIINGEKFVADAICLSADGGYLNPKVVADIFGKEFSETASTYQLLSTALSETYKSELEMMATGVSETLRLCIEEFKKIGSAEDLKAFFAEYKTLLNLSTDFTDKSYANMYEEYKKLDLTQIQDSGTMLDALDGLMKAEKGRVGEFLEALNAASADGNGSLIEEYMTVTYSDLLNITVDTSEISNKSAVFEKMCGITYSSVAEVENMYRSAYNAQLNLEQGKVNSVAISTTSQGFADWNSFASGVYGGATEKTVNGENVAVVSAYENKTKDGKTKIGDDIETVCYHSSEDGLNPSSYSGVKDGETSIILDAGKYAAFEGPTADSASLTTEFDLELKEGSVTGIFTGGYRKITIEFTKAGTSLGELPSELSGEEKLTYRVQGAPTEVSVYAKKIDAPDTEFYYLGTGATTSTAKSNRQVKFTAKNDTAVVSNVGIYSALPSVRYELDGLVLQDDAFFEAKGEEGHTMDDLVAQGLSAGDVTVDSETGDLLLTKAEGASNATVSFNSNVGFMKGNVEYAEIDMRVSVPDTGNLYYYFADSSKSRTKAYLKLNVFNGISTLTNMPWTTGQYYDIKIVTNVAGYDESGQARTAASCYAKKAEDEKWVCLVQDTLLTVAQKDAVPHFVLMNTIAGTTDRISKLSLKTYSRVSETFEYANAAANMPETDYNFSFEYNKMDSGSHTKFTIGGSDYGREFSIQPYRITSELPHGIVADVDVDEDKWYRFFGKVEMTAESPYVHDSSVILKNKITMYLEDAEGNVTLLFEDLPMVKQSGANGLKFGISDTVDAGIMLKNVRVYSGKALDMVSMNEAEGKMTIVADFLNDESVMSDDFTAVGAAYSGDWFKGAESLDVTEDINAFASKRITFENIPCQNGADVVKVFLWNDMSGFVPLIANGVGDNR